MTEATSDRVRPLTVVLIAVLAMCRRRRARATVAQRGGRRWLGRVGGRPWRPFRPRSAGSRSRCNGSAASGWYLGIPPGFGGYQ